MRSASRSSAACSTGGPSADGPSLACRERCPRLSRDAARLTSIAEWWLARCSFGPPRVLGGPKPGNQPQIPNKLTSNG
jgi:hypothetical protein